MRHGIRHRKLGRTSAHRKAMFRNQLTALFTHERIVTTLAKAKELRPMAERMVTLAGTGTLPARRKILTMVSDKDVVRHLFDEIAPRFSERPGGYTRILRLSGFRKGDNAELAILELVDDTTRTKSTDTKKRQRARRILEPLERPQAAVTDEEPATAAVDEEVAAADGTEESGDAIVSDAETSDTSGTEENDADTKDN